MAALTGVAPVSLGLKDWDPEWLQGKAEKIETRGRHRRLTPLGRTARLF